MDEKHRIKILKLQEYIPLGQHIDVFTIEAHKDRQWQQVADGSTIGYQRIVRVRNRIFGN